MSLFVFALLALDMGGAARDLARDGAGAIGPEPAILTVRNVSSLGAGEAAHIRRVLESELRGNSVRLADSTHGAEMRVTISEDPMHYLLVAEIRRAEERRVFIESWPRAAAPPATATQVRLEPKLLFEDDNPILDAAVSGEITVVLESARVLVARAEGRQIATIPAARPWPRDIRGRLSVSGSVFNAWLPGTACHGSLHPQLTIECRDSQEPWLVAAGAIAAFMPDRNFFSGRTVVGSWGGRDLAAFYSAAGAGDAWVFAGTDGRARVYARPWQEAGQIDDWGSDVAGIQTPCGERILATRAVNGSQADAVRPYQIIDGAASLSGPALEFGGPVTALWSADGAAVAVSRDLQTGRYAAFSLVSSCGF